MYITYYRNTIKFSSSEMDGSFFPKLRRKISIFSTQFLQPTSQDGNIKLGTTQGPHYIRDEIGWGVKSLSTHEERDSLLLILLPRDPPHETLQFIKASLHTSIIFD